MADQVLYIRGLQQPSLDHPSVKEELMKDLKAIISISDDKLAALRKRLAETEGFLDPKAMLVTIKRVVKDQDTAKAVRRILESIGPSQVGQVVTLLEDGGKQKGFPFDHPQIERLKQILRDLIRPYPSLARFQKAERLANITGQQLESVELICDLRPIFDESRENVEGMMPYSRLHIVATGEDGLPNAFEVELSNLQVIELAAKVEKAKSKLETLRHFIASWLPCGLPDLPLTRIPQKESSND